MDLGAPEPTYEQLVEHFGGVREVDLALARMFLSRPVNIPENWDVDNILWKFHVKEKTLALLLERLLRDKGIQL